MTKVQESIRPDNICPEIWQVMSKKQKRKSIGKWKVEKAKGEIARNKQGVSEVSAEDKDYFKILSEARATHSQPKFPATPVVRVQECTAGNIAASANAVSEEQVSITPRPCPI